VAKFHGLHETILDDYAMMVRIRQFEERVRSLALGGLVPGLVHLCAGQEAVSVGTCGLLRTDDAIASHHRGHGHCLAKGADPARLMAEILGREEGYCGGRSGSMHVFDPEHSILGTNGIVGGGIPLATGAALARRRISGDSVAVTFFGDGALNQGLAAECMNMAAVWKLPVIYVCENNGFGEFTAIEDVTAGALLARGTVFDIPSEEVDGMDLLAVRAAFGRALARARAGEGPSFLVANTYRYGGHHAGDKQEYKDPEEVKVWAQRDPITKVANLLIRAKLADQATLDRIGNDIKEEIRGIEKAAKSSAEPPQTELSSRVYA
jgi:pyruvate dehydrogenase E1 component alpha subunit